MSTNVKWVMSVMENYAPKCFAYENDNVGLLIGEQNASVDKILVALEITNDVIAEAIEIGANIIVTHHPIIRSSINKITDETPTGQKIIKLIQNGISLFAAHTNLDVTEGGVNDTLFGMIGLQNKEPLMDLPHADKCWHVMKNSKTMPALGRIGNLITPMATSDLVAIIKRRLELQVVNYVGDPSKIVTRIGVCTGSGSSIGHLEAVAKKGCDAYICGDVTHHNAQAALDLGLVVIDATHYATEIVITDVIAERLRAAAESERLGVEVFKSSRQSSPLRQA